MKKACLIAPPSQAKSPRAAKRPVVELALATVASLSLISLSVVSLPSHAKGSDFHPYRNADAGLTLAKPTGWTVRTDKPDNLGGKPGQITTRSCPRLPRRAR